MSATRWSKLQISRLSLHANPRRRDAAVMAPPVTTVKMLGFVRRESHSKLPEAEVKSAVGAKRHCVSLKENLAALRGAEIHRYRL